MQRLSRAALALALLTPLALAVRPAQAQTYTFDDVTAPATYNAVTPGPTEGPTLVFPNITFTGGVILNDSGFNGEATTKPNLLATSDFQTLADGSSLPGMITGTFSAPGFFSGISLDIANGYGAGNFTLTAYDAANHALASSTVFLDPFFSGGVVDGHVSITRSGIDYFTVTSDQTAGSKDFAIDTVNLNPSNPVPEASTTVSLGLLLALGMGGLVVASKRKKISA